MWMVPSALGRGILLEPKPQVFPTLAFSDPHQCLLAAATLLVVPTWIFENRQHQNYQHCQMWMCNAQSVLYITTLVNTGGTQGP